LEVAERVEEAARMAVLLLWVAVAVVDLDIKIIIQ
jgi:hypothetical protein